MGHGRLGISLHTDLITPRVQKVPSLREKTGLCDDAFRSLPREVVLCENVIWLSGGQCAIEYKPRICEVLRDSGRVTYLISEPRSKVVL